MQLLFSYDSDNIVITSGATNGLAMACTHFFKSGDVVFVEDPSYFIAINMLKQDMGMKVIPGWRASSYFKGVVCLFYFSVPLAFQGQILNSFSLLDISILKSC